MPTTLIHTGSRLSRLPIRSYVCRSCRVERRHATFKSVASFGASRFSSPNEGFLIPTTPAVTRFAPSPTGYLHLGSLRTALYSYLLAKRTGGSFILRVEDTDQARTVPGAEERLYADLKWAGILWDEGPDKSGPNGPYRQSERLAHYHEAGSRMLQEGTAYRCFCSSESLDAHKQQSLDTGGDARYPGTCRGIDRAESDRRAEAAEAHVVRFRAPEGRISFKDLTYGQYAKQEEEDDFVLLKTDGFPTYHFANVVDDHLMKVTHVIRGVEWLISTPKHIALYKALGWQPPAYAHAPLLTAPGGAKLSKRDRAVDISSYQDSLVLPAALNNWAALLGCQMRKADNSEVFSMQELVDNFTLKFTKGNTTINPQKIAAFQTAHLKATIRGDPVVAEHTLLKPTLAKLLALDAARQSSEPGATLSLAKGDTRALDPASLGELTDAFRSTDGAMDYLRRIWKTNDTRYADGVSIIFDHPHLFWTVPRSRYLRVQDALQRDPRQPLNAAASGLLIAHFMKALDVPGSDWSAASLGTILTEATSKESLARLSAGIGDIAARDAWSVLRLAMVGSPDAPTKPAKLLLSLLGRDEVLRRFRELKEVTDGATVDAS